jgi:hypothetical protein
MASKGLPSGVTACSYTKDLVFFAVAFMSGYVGLYSSRDLEIKGLAFTGVPVTEL